MTRDEWPDDASKIVVYGCEILTWVIPFALLIVLVVVSMVLRNKQRSPQIE